MPVLQSLQPAAQKWGIASPRYKYSPNQLGPEYNLHILDSFAKHVAPALGWKPNTEGPAEAYSL